MIRFCWNVWMIRLINNMNNWALMGPMNEMKFNQKLLRRVK